MEVKSEKVLERKSLKSCDKKRDHESKKRDYYISKVDQNLKKPNQDLKKLSSILKNTSDIIKSRLDKNIITILIIETILIKTHKPSLSPTVPPYLC